MKQFDSVEILDLSTHGNDSMWNTTILGDEALFRYGKISSASMSPSGRYLAASYAATKVGKAGAVPREVGSNIVTQLQSRSLPKQSTESTTGRNR